MFRRGFSVSAAALREWEWPTSNMHKYSHGDKFHSMIWERGLDNHGQKCQKAICVYIAVHETGAIERTWMFPVLKHITFNDELGAWHIVVPWSPCVDGWVPLQDQQSIRPLRGQESDRLHCNVSWIKREERGAYFWSTQSRTRLSADMCEHYTNRIRHFTFSKVPIN